MMYATRIKMKAECSQSNNTQEIAEIYVTGCDNPGYFTKSVLHDFVIEHPNSIAVNLPPYPYLVPAVSSLGEKYVRSAPNDTLYDNLLRFPRD